jgi:hypothetical protein
VQIIDIEYCMDRGLKSFPFDRMMDTSDVFDMLWYPSLLVVEDVFGIIQVRFSDVNEGETDARGLRSSQAKVIGGDGKRTRIRSSEIDIVAIPRERHQTRKPSATLNISVIL